MENFTTTEDALLFTSSAPQESVDIGILVLQVASFIIGTFGLLGNGCVILVCLLYPLRVSNILICNQSLIDFFSSLIFALIYGLFYESPLPPGRKTATFFCKMWVSEYPLWALGVSSTANLIFITLERYVAIMYPFAHRIKFTSTKAKLIAILPWVIGLLHELPWAMSNNPEDGICVHQWWSEKIGFIIGMIIPITHYILPLLIMSFVYTRILFKLRSREFGTSKADDDKKSDQNVTNRASRNVIKTMFLVSLTYLVCWGPNEFIYFYNNMGGYVDWGSPYYYYSAISALCNMCVNPFIYTLSFKEFRVKLGKLFMSICPNGFCKNERQQSHSVSNVSTTRV